MADRDSERDRRIRDLLSGGDSKDKMAVMSQAQAELSDIQSELQNNLSLAQTQDQARLRQTQTISQVAQGMLESEQNNQLQSQVATMNPQTQATMGRYGVKPETKQNTTSNNSSNRVVSKSGDVTNVKNENITNNHTEIRVTQPTIPVQQPNIPVQQTKQDNTAKFRSWLSEMFAKQENEAEIQRKEYRKKEWNLGRMTSRLMGKISDTAEGISTRLDPRNVAGSISGQIKWLLMIFGATMISKVWTPAMKFLANLEYGFRAVFGLPINEDLKNASTNAVSVIDQIKGFIGIKKGESDTLINGIGKVFMQGIDKLIDKLKFWFEDRSKAISSIEFPKMDPPDFGALGGVLSPILSGFSDTFKGVAQYLSDVITVALGGSAGRVKAVSRRAARKAQEVYTNTTGKNTSVGDTALINGSGRDYMRNSDYDMLGNLKSNASSTQAMSRSIISLFNDKSNKAHTLEIGSGIEQLFDVADRQGKVVVDPELLQYLGLSSNEIYGLQRGNKLYQEKYRIIQVKPRSKTDMLDAGVSLGTGQTIGKWVGGTAGLVGGGYLGSFMGGALGGAIGYGVGGAVGDAIEDATKRDDLIPKLVPANSSERSEDGSLGVPKTMWVLTKSGADEVAARFTHNMADKTMDNTNKEFYEKIRDIEEKAKRRVGVNGALTQNLSGMVNEMRSAHSAKEYSKKQYYDHFESKDPTSHNMTHYGAWNTFSNNFSNLISSAGNYAVSWSAGALRSGANYLRREKLTPKEQQGRALYAMHRLVQEGLTPAQASGVVGNLYQESRLIANAGGDDLGQESGGIAQWRGPRLRALERYFGKSYKEIPFNDQLEYFIKEIKGELDDPNASGRASRSLVQALGSKYSTKDTIFDSLKKAESAEEAAIVQERGFEISGDWKIDRDGKRIAYANGYLSLYNQNPGAGQNYQSKPLPNINLSNLKDDDVKSGQKLGVGWLGDSQSCVLNGLFPVLVGSALETSFSFYARGSANATHYLGTGNTKNLSSPSTNIQGYSSKSCADALEYMLTVRPKYCFIALGHNGMSGYQSLVEKLKNAGIKVICIKMWSTQAASGTGMRSYSKEEMSNMYKNITGADGMIDLTQIDIPKSKDGVHASKEGCYIAAREVIQQLSGAGVTSGSGDEIEPGLLGKTSKILAGGLDKAADFLEGKETPSVNPDPFANLTAGQRKKLNAEMVRQQREEELNVKSWETMGAKTDERGTYFENNGTRVYVRTDGTHNGYTGLKQSDIDWIEKVDPSGKPDKTPISEKEASVAMNITILNTKKFFENYPEKDGTDDCLKDGNGKTVFIKLGKFGDFDTYEEHAQKDFSDGVTFLIAPTLDFTSWNIVKISPNVSSSYPISVLALPDTPVEERTVYYGPEIYNKHKKWISWRTVDETKPIHIHMPPVCEVTNVKLTPNATQSAIIKLNFLRSLGKVTQDVTGEFRDQHGKQVTRNKIDALSRMGLSPKILLQNPISVTPSKFKLGAYSKQLGIGGTKKDREKYYNTHKKEFTVIDNKIYGSGGVIWGETDAKGKATLYDNEKIESSTTERSLKDNEKKIAEKRDQDISIGAGYVSRTAMAKFLASTAENNIKKKVRISVMSDTLSFQSGDKILKIRFTRKFNNDGTETCTVRSSDIKSAIQSTLRDKDGKSVIIPNEYIKFDTLTESSVYKLYSSVLTVLNNAVKNISKEDIKKYGGKKDIRNNAFIMSSSTKYNWKTKSYLVEDNLTQETLNNILSKKSPITRLDGQKIIFENGDELSLNKDDAYYFGKSENILKINKIIQTNLARNRRQAAIDTYTGSELEAQHKALIEQTNKGTVQFQEHNGFLYTTGGDMYAKRDKSGKIVQLKGDEVLNEALRYFNQNEPKASFLTDALKLKKEGNDYYYTNGNYRTKVNLNSDLSGFLDNGLKGLRGGITSVQKIVNGKWTTVDDNNEEGKQILNNLSGGVQKLVTSNDYTAQLIKMLKDNYNTDAKVAREIRVKQFKTAAQQKALQTTTNDLLGEIAQNKQLTADDVKNIINNNDKKATNETESQENLLKYIEDNPDVKANATDYEIYTTNNNNARVSYKKPGTTKNYSNEKLVDSNGDGIIGISELNAAGVDAKIVNKAGKSGYAYNGLDNNVYNVVNINNQPTLFKQGTGYILLTDTGETLGSVKQPTQTD